MKRQLRKLQLRGEPMAFAPVVRGVNRLEVRNEGDSAEIVLIGAVGKSWFDDSGITEKEFRDALKTIPSGKSVTVLVNSEGGSVKEGLGIYNAIKSRCGDITCKITGYALSIASVFPLAAGKVISPKSAIWMMHKAWSWNQGNADDMRQAAEMLDAHDETLVDIYAEATGKSKADIRSAMEQETWVKGADAVAWGLADETDSDEDDSQAAYRPLAKDFISRCKNLSPEILNCITPAVPAAAAGAAGGSNAVTSVAPQGAAQPKQKQQTNMNKTIVVALLAAHGILDVNGKPFTDNSTETELEAGLKQIPTAKAPEPKPAADPNAALAADVLALKTARVADKINAHVDRGVITKVEAAIYLRESLISAKNETDVLALLDGKTATEGVIAGTHFEVGAIDKPEGIEGKALPELINGFKAIPSLDRSVKGKIVTAEARYNFMKDEWNSLMASAMRKDDAWTKRTGAMPVASNTYSSSLVTNYLIMGAVTRLSPQFAPLAAFSRDNSVDPIKPLATGQMKFNTTAQDGSTAQTVSTNTDFEGSGDSTLTNVAISTAHIFENMHVNDYELNSGLRMEDLTTAKFASLASKVMQTVGTYITAANFTATPVIKDSTSFSWSDMRVLWGQLKKAGVKNAILDGEYLASLQNLPTFLQTVPEFPGAGWRNINNWAFLGLNTEWSSSGTNIRGFACNPQAIGIISGVPMNPPQGVPGNTLMTTYVTLPGLNTTIAVNVWFSLGKRALYASLDIVIGANALDTTAGIVIASGTPT